jgi:hypothetical protein
MTFLKDYRHIYDWREEMKNQFFGDVNDFRKYGLLRVLTGCTDSKNDYNNVELTLAVCWMLTTNDDSSHGGKTSYLSIQIPNIYSNLDYYLFNYFVELDIANGKNRNVKHAQNDRCLPMRSLFYSQHIFSERRERTEYFNNFLNQAKEFDILFYDPDNGMNVKSHRYGTKHSNKFLYWCELIDSYWSGQSILIFQHFARPIGGRDLFISNMANELKQSIGIDEIYSFKSSHVVFFLLPQDRHSVVFKGKIEFLREKWSSNRAIKKAGFTEIKKH